MHTGVVFLLNTFNVVKGSGFEPEPCFPKPYKVFLLPIPNQTVTDRLKGKGKNK